MTTPNLSRRRFLTATGATGAAMVAGCTAGYSAPEDGTDPQDSEATPRSTPTNPTDPAELTDHPYTAPPATVEIEDGATETIRVRPARHELVAADAAGGPITLPEVWAWEADGHDPSVPGPLYRVEAGASFNVELENTNDVRPHTFHVHGFRKDWMDDGVPTTTGVQVNPDESHTYEYDANVPGTHLYHCHYQTHNHLDMGMYGLMRVDPEGYEPADVEEFLTLREWDEDLSLMMAGADVEFEHRHRAPNLFSINGRAAPTTFHPEVGSPIVVSQGDTVRLHFVNAGYESHTIHVHNHRFEVVEKDGATVPEAARHKEDIEPIAPAERKTIEFEADADPGIYLMHCHRVNHATNRGSYPGGMATAVVYEEVMDTPQFAEAMEKAGYEG